MKLVLSFEQVCMTNEMVGGKEALPYVVPRKNIRIEAPVAIIDRCRIEIQYVDDLSSFSSQVICSTYVLICTGI